MIDRFVRTSLFAALVCAVPAAAFAHGPETHIGAAKKSISKEEYAWGRQGAPERAARTIRVEMSDAMRFDPAAIEVRAGDTVKFAVRNGGKLMHEMVIGTEQELQKHAEMMRKHPGMEHGEPYMAHVAPGENGEIAWTFTRPGRFMYGCLIPGHWEAGMKGVITVVAR